MRLLATALIIAGLSLSGCASAVPGVPTDGDPPPMSDATTITLNLGASTELPDGSHLSYLRLVNDSRCAPGVQCVWAGNAEIALRWKSTSGRQVDASVHTSGIRNMSKEARFGPYLVRLEELERGIAPAATLRILPAPP